jgi:hypothetical protein
MMKGYSNIEELGQIGKLVEAKFPTIFCHPLKHDWFIWKKLQASTLQSKAQHHEMSPLFQFHKSIREIS